MVPGLSADGFGKKPLPGPAGYRSAGRRKARSVGCTAATLGDRRQPSEASLVLGAPGPGPEARFNWATGPVGKARIVTRQGGDKANALAP